METYVCQSIAAEELNTDLSFCLRYDTRDMPLEESVRKRGILAPVVVAGGKKYVLISGHRRLRAALSAGIKELQAFVILADMNPKDLFWLSVLSNLNHVWPDLDRAWTICKAVEKFGFDESEVIDELLPVLGLVRGRNVFKEYWDVAHFEKELLDRVAVGKLPFQGLHRLSAFNSGEQHDFAVEIADKAALTTGELNHFCEWLHDVLKAKPKTIRCYLEEQDLLTILDHPDWDRRQKGEKLFKKMRELRFPNLTSYEETFRTLSAAIQQNCHDIKIEPPPNFEENGFIIRAKVGDSKVLEKVVAVLGREKSSLISLFDIRL